MNIRHETWSLREFSEVQYVDSPESAHIHTQQLHMCTYVCTYVYICVHIHIDRSRNPLSIGKTWRKRGKGRKLNLKSRVIIKRHSKEALTHTDALALKIGMTGFPN